MEITTAQLVNVIYDFCELYSGVTLFPYQAQSAKRLIRSVLEHDGDELTMMYSRQCIPKGSVIHTRDGKLVKIEEHPDAWLTRKNAEIIEIRAKGGYVIRCTKNHPIKTNIGWLPAGLLQEGDLIEVLDKWDKFGEGIVPYKFKQFVNMHRTDIIEGTYVMTEELAELLGWLTSDGYVMGKNQSIKFTNTNINYLRRVEYLVTKYFKDIKVKWYEKGDGYDLLFTTGSKNRFNTLKDFIRAMKFNEDGFPEAVNYFTREQVIAFFKGMFASDGYVHLREDGKNIEIGLACGNSRVYAEFCRELLNKLGISGQIKEEWHNKSKKPFYRILILGQRNARIFKEVIGDILDKPIPDSLFANYTRENKVYCFTDVDGEVIKYARVVSIKDAGKADVYDVEYPGKGWFIYGGVKVHNSGKSQTVSVIAGGLALILPTLANMPMFAGDKRLEMYKRGVLIGIFAPAMHQAQIIFGRIRDFLNSDTAQEVLQDPDFRVHFNTNNGQNIALSNGSVVTCMSASDGSNIEGKSYMLIICDESQDISDFKYYKSISPMGAFYNATKVLIGTPTYTPGFFYQAIMRNKKIYEETGKRNHFEYNYKTVIKYNENYAKYVEGEKFRLGEDSDEFRLSYALEWIFERGLFVNSENFEKQCGMPDKNWTFSSNKPVVVGIDLAKKNDKTVIAVIAPDWDNPVIVEPSKTLQVPDYVAYNKELLDIKILEGENYEEQYYQIIDYLRGFKNVVRVVVDGTGVGSPIVDRLQANTNFEVIPFVFSKQSKSDLYKHFDIEIKAGRFKFPASEEAQQTREYKLMINEFFELQKTYSGNLLIVRHPDGKDKHDDIPDAIALAVWGSKSEGMSKPTLERKNPFIEKDLIIVYNKARNRFTAKRR